MASALVRRKLEFLPSCDGRRCRGLLAPAKLAAISTYAMQDHRQLAGHRDTSARQAATLDDVHAPRPQR